MTQQIEPNEVSELRHVVAQTIGEEAVSSEVAESARYHLDEIRREAAEYGFSDADVIRAVLRPLFRRTKGCDCYTCSARRGEMGEDNETETRQVFSNAS